jgi:hypothetical protein
VNRFLGMARLAVCGPSPDKKAFVSSWLEEYHDEAGSAWEQAFKEKELKDGEEA